MEKEGFIRGLKIFEDYDLPVKMLVTDRHKALSKWIRENLPEIKHRYDVWHVAKSMTVFKFHPYPLSVSAFIYSSGFRKKVEKLAQKTECSEVGGWIKSMVNHLYWSAMSTKDDDCEMVLEKWKSLGKHIHNVH